MDLVPIGYYRAVPVPAVVDGQEVSVQFGRSKVKGTLQAAVMFAILDEGSYRGRRLRWMGYFTDDSVDRTIEALRLCGFKGDELSELPRQKLDQEVSITVEHEEYDGKTRAKVAWVNAAGGGMKMANPLNATELRQFSAKYKAKVRSKPAVDGPKAAPPSVAAPASASAPAADPGEPPEDKGDDPWAAGNEPPPPHNDSDIPF
jgi:hypothetical protein